LPGLFGVRVRAGGVEGGFVVAQSWVSAISHMTATLPFAGQLNPERVGTG
jgi:hypothetical protein